MMSRHRLPLFAVLLPLLLLLVLLPWRMSSAAQVDALAVEQVIIVEPAVDRCVEVYFNPDFISAYCKDTSTSWGVGAWNTEPSASYDRGLIRFDLPALPAGSTITEARFFAFAPKDLGRVPASIGLHRITSDWDAATTTWSSQPDHVATPEDITSVQPDQEGYVSWLVTNLAQDWYRGQPNFGVKLINVTEQMRTMVRFTSREASGNHPYLRIVLQLPTPTPTDTPVPPTPTDTPVPPTPTNIPALPYRDIGNMRIWADQFALAADGSTTATGQVMVGPRRDDGQYFTISESASWRGVNALSLRGAIGFVRGGQLFGRGDFSVNPYDGVATWAPGNEVLYRTLGASALPITPTLTLNVLSSQVQARADVGVSLIENAPTTLKLDFAIGFHGVITTTGTVPISFKLAGGTLNAQVRADAQGLAAAQADYTLNGVGTIKLTDLVIDGKGETHLRFGAEAEFPLPVLTVEQGFFVFQEPKGRLTVDYSSGKPASYSIQLRGDLSLPRLPENSAVRIKTAELRIVDGGIGGTLQDVELNVAGKPFKVKGASFGRRAKTAGLSTQALSFRYELYTQGAEFPLPQSWAPKGFAAPQIFVQNVVISSEPNYLSIGTVGGGFKSDKEFYLAGNAQTKASVRFDQISGNVRYTDIGGKWVIDLNARVTFTFGKDSSTASAVKLTLDQGHVSGQITQIDLTIAGLKLSVTQLSYQDDTFAAATAALTLPASWGTGTAQVNGLTIGTEGLKLGGGGGEFGISDRQIGKVLSIRNTRAAVLVSDQRLYSIAVTTTLTLQNIESVSTNSLAVGGTLRIRDGRVDGTIDGFAFRVAGLSFQVSQPRFLDNRITAQVVRIALPDKLGGAGAMAYGLEIGGERGLSLRGGGFKLPDFTIAGTGVQNVQAEIMPQPDGSYGLKAAARLQFATFGVDGGFTLAYTPPSDVRLRQVTLAFQGAIPDSAIPLGNTGLFLTYIRGTFDLTDGALRINFDARAAFAYEFHGIALASVEGSVGLVVRPFELKTSAATKVLGIAVQQVDLRITPSSFELRGLYERQIARASIEIFFGKDSDGEFTFYGNFTQEIGIRKGSIACFDTVIVGRVCVPPFDFTLARRALEAGKFYHDNQKMWGARGQATAFGFDFFIFLEIAPDLNLDVGTNLDVYRPVPVASVMANNSHIASVAGRRRFDVNVSEQAQRLTIAEVLAPANRTTPQPLIMHQPDGKTVNLTLAYEANDKTFRTYTFDFDSPAQAIGIWQLYTQDGNELMVWGADPPPQVARFDVTTASGMQLAATGAPLNVPNGQVFQLDWQVTNNEPGLAVEIYAVDRRGVRYPIASRRTQIEANLQGTTTWKPALPSGTYTITLGVDDFKHVSTIARTQPIVITDTTPPTAPRNLAVRVRPDGSALLTWDGATAEADVAGYQVTVDNQQPLRQDGHLSEFEVFGLQAGGKYRIAAAAYDLSGNIGPAALVEVTVSPFGVDVSFPRRGDRVSLVTEVRATLNEPVSAGALTIVDSRGQQIAGTTSPITMEVGIGEMRTIGTRWKPSRGALLPGTYSARLTASNMSNGIVADYTWSFTVIPYSQSVYLPMIRR
jgi:hypothetical protein